ncbi:MAG: TIGR03013 family PEP-CTERM/XrtA system glycosyltransferase, partial [Haliea sp.]|nr:TIGR03013 family PEP-CTERM/XrtA system glycosyltransferase [Haliea sp.]
HSLYPSTGLLAGFPAEAAMFAAVLMFGQYAVGLYAPRMREDVKGVLLRAISSFVIAFLVLAIIFVALLESDLNRTTYALAAAFAFGATLINRIVFNRILNRDRFKRRVLVYGVGEAASAISDTMRRRSDRRNFTIVGFVGAGDEPTRPQSERITNPQQPLAEYVRQAEIDQIVVALDAAMSDASAQALCQCRDNGIEVVELVDFFEREAGKILVDFVSPARMAFIHSLPRRGISRLLKRGFDIAAGLLLFAVTWPVMLVTAVAIWLEDGIGAQILFSQERVGLDGKTFRLLKFRSMREDAEADGISRWASRNDSRVTRVGAVIRRLRIDELPQIINVLAGQMAFIGPRPERPEFVADLSAKIPYYAARHCVKPGITGWAQLNYPYGASVEDSRQKLQFDLYYFKNHSLVLDLMICIATVEVILFGKGAR